MANTEQTEAESRKYSNIRVGKANILEILNSLALDEITLTFSEQGKNLEAFLNLSLQLKNQVSMVARSDLPILSLLDLANLAMLILISVTPQLVYCNSLYHGYPLEFKCTVQLTEIVLLITVEPDLQIVIHSSGQHGFSCWGRTGKVVPLARLTTFYLGSKLIAI